jgi:pilus assembly protein CpaE
VERSIIICLDEALAEQLTNTVVATGEVWINKIIGRYPSPLDLVRIMRAHAPDIIFLDFESVEKAQDVVKLVETETPGVQIIAIARDVDAKLLRESMRVGIREFLSPPFQQQAVVEALQHVKKVLERTPPKHETTSQIFTFLPSKAGVGTSTIALNTSAAMARKLKLRTLLSDFDLNSGMMRFLLKLENSYSIIDAIHHYADMDEVSWAQLATSFGNLDVIHAGRIQPNLRVEPAQIRSLVEFIRRNYQVVCFDVSGNLEKYSLELMRESRRVLLVCTQEIPSLHLAREKMAFLKEADLETRVTVLLNRCYKRPMISKEQVEDLLGVPVVTMFPNDYHGVNQAMAAGTWVKPDSDLGKAFEHFARELQERRPPNVATDKKKFLEFFSVPARPLASGQK